jgi:tRNA(Arg) A34 adenosine deaminase TadA
MTDNDFLKKAIEQAEISLQKGGFPAGAVLVKNGKIISESDSLGSLENDPSGHAEMMCIRDACKKLDTTNLDGCVVYASMESCLMCFSTANWANISRIVYACEKNDDLVGKFCYEGTTSLKDVNENNNHKIELEYVSGFEEKILSMIKEWKPAGQ